MTPPVHVGIMLPSRETAMTGRHDARGLVEFAKTAEEAGFDSVWVGDSLLARTRAEPLSILSAAAAVTERVSLGTAALIAPLRHPLLAASQAATVDQLSRGRLILGLGSGAPLPESRREFDAVGMPFAGRGPRLDRSIALWRETWSGQGEFADALPSARAGGPPVWLAGGDTTKVIERVAATYDGWLPYLPDVNAYARAWDRIRAQAVREVTPALYATVNLDGRALTTNSISTCAPITVSRSTSCARYRRSAAAQSRNAWIGLRATSMRERNTSSCGSGRLTRVPNPSPNNYYPH